MTPSNTTTKEAYLKDGYYKEFKASIYQPSLTVSDVKEVVEDISYKNVADWSGKEVLGDFKQSGDKGWRRFTIANVVKLKIISEARKTGLPIKEIKSALESICSISIDVSLVNQQKQVLAKVKMPSFDYGLLSSIARQRMFLLICDRKPSIVSATQAIEHYFNELGGKKPLVLIPLSAYVKQVVSVMLKNDPLIQALSQCNVKAV